MQWNFSYGVWFSGPYRILRSHEHHDYCLWFYGSNDYWPNGKEKLNGRGGMLKRGFSSLQAAQCAAAGHSGG